MSKEPNSNNVAIAFMGVLAFVAFGMFVDTCDKRNRRTMMERCADACGVRGMESWNDRNGCFCADGPRKTP